MEVAWITAAFALGLAARALGLPTLIGYLLAGFVLNLLGWRGGAGLDAVAHAGVLLLLFSVGLKLRLATLARPEVWLGGLGHLVGVAGLGALVASGLAGFAPGSALLLGAALAFSSTVMAAKVLEEKAELRAFHGRTAIGILILQDLVAVTLLGAAGGQPPSPWAGLWLGLPLLRRGIQRLLQLSGHGELLLLYGMVLALVVGGAGFEGVGLSPELGALVLGMLLADHPRSKELANTLWAVKELFLVGFFLSIGMAALPGRDALLIAGVLLLLLPLKSVLYFAVLVALRLRARTAFLAALALFSYSEFGLILARLGARDGWLEPQWLTGLALAVAASFAWAAPLNRASHQIFAWLEPWLTRFESERRHPDDEPISLDGAEAVVLGMGRVGSGAYDQLRAFGARVIGLDSDPTKVRAQREAGRATLYGDAEDPDLWQRLDLTGVRAVLLALPDLEAKRFAATQLRRRGFRGLILATSVFPEEAETLRQDGVDVTFNYYERAGETFARRAWERLEAGDAAAS